MKTKEQIKQDIIKYTERSIGEGEDGLVGTIRRSKEADEKRKAYLNQASSFIERLRRILSKQARRKYQEERSFDEFCEREQLAKDLEDYKSFLESVRNSTASGESLERVTQIIDDYESKGNSHRTYSLRARFPKFLEREIRTNYLDIPIDKVKIQYYDRHSLDELMQECREHPEMASSELVNQLFERMKDLYKRACQVSAERGYKPIAFVSPGSGAIFTLDYVAYDMLKDVARMKGVKEPELEVLRKQLEGDIGLSKLEKGKIRIQVC